MSNLKASDNSQEWLLLSWDSPEGDATHYWVKALDENNMYVLVDSIYLFKFSYVYCDVSFFFFCLAVVSINIHGVQRMNPFDFADSSMT